MNSGAGAAPNLSPAHAALLAQYRIPPDLLAAAGVRGATDTEVRDALGFNAHRGCDLSGLLFPLRHPRTADHLGAWVRLNSPPTGCGKYLQPRGCRRLYVPPLPAEWLDDPAVPAVIVEGPKSALALLALAQRRGRSLVPIATGGCWGWRRNDGFRELPGGGHEPVTAPSPMFDLLEWQGRKAVLALDGDARANPGVAAARRALAS